MSRLFFGLFAFVVVVDFFFVLLLIVVFCFSFFKGVLQIFTYSIHCVGSVTKKLTREIHKTETPQSLPFFVVVGITQRQKTQNSEQSFY